MHRGDVWRVWRSANAVHWWMHDARAAEAVGELGPDHPRFRRHPGGCGE